MPIVGVRKPQVSRRPWVCEHRSINAAFTVRRAPCGPSGLNSMLLKRLSATKPLGQKPHKSRSQPSERLSSHFGRRNGEDRYLGAQAACTAATQPLQILVTR